VTAGENCWAVLGLEVDADERAIKRAYARLLKLNRPEDNASAFQQLRHAYEMALALVASGVAPAELYAAPELEPEVAPEASLAGETAAASEPLALQSILTQLWHLNVAEDGEGVAALLAEARDTLALDEIAELATTLRQICAFDTRVSQSFFATVDTAMRWEHAPPARNGEEARLDHALQLRREHWRAHGLLAGKLNALKAALAAQNWEEAGHLSMRLLNALQDLGLDWRESVEQEVIGMLAASESVPRPLLERITESWGGGRDYTQARSPAWQKLEHRLQEENLWSQLEHIRDGRLAVNWHYRRAVENLFMRWPSGWKRHWRALYGAQQEMSRGLIGLLQDHYPSLLQQLDARTVQWWQTPRPDLGLYPERWTVVALFIALVVTHAVIALLEPGTWTATLQVLVLVVSVGLVLRGRHWLGWRWHSGWRMRFDAWECRLTRRLLPSRWRHAADQHYRVLEYGWRAAALAFVPALLVGVAATDEGSIWPATMTMLLPFWLVLQGWFVRRALRGELPLTRDAERIYQIDQANPEKQGVPSVSRLFIVILLFVWWLKLLEYLG
jgi:hypothetical protein